MAVRTTRKEKLRMRRIQIRWAIGFLPASAIVAALFFAQGTSTVATASAASASAASCSTKPVTVAYVPKLNTDPYWAAARTGELQAAKEIGGKVIQVAPSQATAAAQSNIIANLVSQGGIGTIVIAANDANAVVPALKRAQAAGIKVMAFDSDVNPSARTLFASQANFNTVGQQMLASIAQQLGYTGEIGILTDGADVTNEAGWANAVKAELNSNPKYKNMKLDFLNYGQSSAQVYTQVALSEIQAYPNLKGIIIPAGIGLPAVASTLAQKGLLGKIKLTGLAPASIIKKYILDGSVTDIWWKVPDLGYMSYYMAQDLAQCKLTGKVGQKFKAGRLGTKTVGADGVVIEGPALLVTKENIGQFPF
jgi:rhamnose transport system substrate-binding protein